MTPKQLQKALKTLDMKPAELARAMGYHESSISRYVNGKKDIPQNFANHLNLMLALCKKEV